MKRGLFAALAALMLCGCATTETFETIADEPVQPVMAVPRQITVSLPDEAAAPVLESGTEQIYFCEDYEIIIETAASGDLDATMRHLSGYGAEELTVVHTSPEGCERYEFVWVCAGEAGERIGRAVIVDDGQYHYCMSVLRDAENTEKSQIVWNEVFSSFRLI